MDRIKQVISDIADDPEGFVNNLVDAVKQGFQQFFDNFGTHVIEGFWQWLFQGLTKLGVRIPADFSLGSLVKLALEIMGISWPRIRGVLVKHIGERNVVLIEHAWTLISTLVEKGVDGVLELLKGQLDPVKLIDQVISAAIDFLIETVVKKVGLKILAMLNPATAVLQAIQLIYDVLVWIFQNAARIFKLIEAVVGGIADIIAGRIAGAAAVVEKALAMMIPSVIDFFAELLGLGDLPWKIADIVKQLQAYVLSLIDRAVKFLVDKVKALLGIGDEKGGGEDVELGEEVSFRGEEGESHRQWIDPSGTPMMASTTETVEDRLKEWRQEAKAQFKDNPDKLEKLRDLIDQAQAKVKEVKKEADGLAAQYKNPKPGAKLPSDDPLEALQVELAGLLTQIFKAFGGDIAAIRKDIAERLPRHGEARREELVTNWADRIVDFRIGNEPKDPKLWPNRVLAGIGDRAEAVTEKKSEQEQLTTWFTTAPGKRAAETAEFADYAFVQMSAPHTVRRDFTVALGSEAGAVLKDTAKSNIADTENVDDDYKTKLLGLVDRIQFTWSSAGGTWTLPTERLPDHGRYKPLNIKISNDGQTVKYTTVTKQEFTVTLDPKTGLTSSIVGRNLRLGLALPGQRGKTAQAPGQVSGLGLDAAHLIADRFGGSGYVAGLNLVATSENYNRKKMKRAEDAIVRVVEQYADKRGLDRTEVDFDLQVEITTVKLPTGAVVSAIKKEERFKAGDEFDADIAEAIVEGEKVPELRRVKSVTYTLRLDGRVKYTTTLDEDVDMLK